LNFLDPAYVLPCADNQKICTKIASRVYTSFGIGWGCVITTDP
jgi:hypothetical protein